jgi:predicted nucleotidyltransferase
MDTVRDKILHELGIVERSKNVTILYACESGSRAWGFPSRDSDYDVRFVYIHSEMEWYFRLQKERDVIEKTIGRFDMVGWDMQKALRLLRKGNPPLMEKLDSPIVYIDRHGIAGRMRKLKELYFSKLAAMHHYWNMARGNHRDYLQHQTVWRKKYFYVLRPLLAIRWLEMHESPPPMEFSKLVESTGLSETLQAAIERLVKEKLEGEELGVGPRISVISKFIDREIHRGNKRELKFARLDMPPWEPFNQLFLAALHSASSIMLNNVITDVEIRYWG